MFNIKLEKRDVLLHISFLGCYDGRVHINNCNNECYKI